MRRILYLLLFLAFNCHAWNSMGHQLVAQIAFDNLSPEAKKIILGFNQHSKKKRESTHNFIIGATWLDRIKKRDIHWYDHLHYIDIPYSQDNTPLPPQSEINALWAINQAQHVLLSSKASDADKAFSLRVLTHVVGDIHQPLHTITQVSQRVPTGDKGGNLFRLTNNPLGVNLHQYWDNGGGLLIGHMSPSQIKNKAQQLENKWSCAKATIEKNPRHWVDASHQLALSQAYTIQSNIKPSVRYQLNVQKITEKQIVFAGCRLAFLLNKVAQS